MKITYITAAFVLAFSVGCAGNTSEDISASKENLAEGEDALASGGPATASACPAAAAGFRVVACGAPLNADVAGISGNTVFTSVTLTWDPAGPKNIYSQRFGSNRATLFAANAVGFKLAGSTAFWVDAPRTTMFRRAVGSTGVRSMSAASASTPVFGNFDVRGPRVVFLAGLLNANYLSMGSDLRGPSLLTGQAGFYMEEPFLASNGEFFGYAQDGFSPGFLKRFSDTKGTTAVVDGFPQIRSNPVDDAANVYTLVRGLNFHKLRVLDKATGAVVDRPTSVSDAGESLNVLTMGSGRIFGVRSWGFGGNERQVFAIDTSTGATTVALDIAKSGFRMPSYVSAGVFNNTPVVSLNASSGIAQSVILSAN